MLYVNSLQYIFTVGRSRHTVFSNFDRVVLRFGYLVGKSFGGVVVSLNFEDKTFDNPRWLGHSTPIRFFEVFCVVSAHRWRGGKWSPVCSIMTLKQIRVNIKSG